MNCEDVQLGCTDHIEIGCTESHCEEIVYTEHTGWRQGHHGVMCPHSFGTQTFSFSLSLVGSLGTRRKEGILK